jgi:hypothetical protein
MSELRARLTGPVLDAADPVALAESYAQLLGWEIVAPGGSTGGVPVRGRLGEDPLPRR